MAFNPSELILDRVRYLTAHDLTDRKMFMRLSSLEEPSLNCQAEGEEIVDALGSLITTLYRAKKADFSASNSLISLDLAAAQYGTKKEVASSTSKIIVPTFETIDVASGTTTVTLKHTPVNEIGYIYQLADGEIATTYKASSSATATEFVVGDNGAITVPTGMTGKLYVEYDYEEENAVRVVNRTDKFPEACSVKIYAYFRDKCNENLVYSGVIICNKAKLNPEAIELALTSTGKHPFTFQMMKDYCDDSSELFSIIIAGGQE